jgi:hypothetical protein
VKKSLMIACALLLLLLIPLGLAAANPDFSIPWWTVDGGGGTSQGGDFSLSGTAGQPDTAALQGGDFTLQGGFWAGAAPLETQLFLPSIRR